MPEYGQSSLVPSPSSRSFVTPMLPTSSGMQAQWPGMPMMLALGTSGPSSMNGYPVFAVMNSEGGVCSVKPFMYQMQLPTAGGRIASL
jgi:hypothetical protein